MKEIKLTKGQVALVDDKDYERMNKYKWYAQWRPKAKTYYAVRNIRKPNGKRGTELMHRVLACAPDDKDVDHKNGKTLDNTSENLLVSTTRENMQNRHSAESSIYPGVSFNKRDKRWISRIRLKERRVTLGYFKTEKAAFDAYIKACIENGFCIERLIERFNLKEVA
jgi:hypothetical protein